MSGFHIEMYNRFSRLKIKFLGIVVYNQCKNNDYRRLKDRAVLLQLKSILISCTLVLVMQCHSKTLKMFKVKDLDSSYSTEEH